MIFIDTETTGLLKPETCDLGFQPFITEIYAVRLTDDYHFVGEIETFVRPPVPIPDEVVKITNITNEMVKNAPSFPLIYDELVNLFLGERKVIGHNCPFDMGVLYCELKRMECEFHFPWPPEWICTVERSFQIENRRLHLRDLHTLATGAPHPNAHRAKDDVIALVYCYQWLEKQGLV